MCELNMSCKADNVLGHIMGRHIQPLYCFKLVIYLCFCACGQQIRALIS